ncbi:PREDICTED: diacylglycerol kinase A-like [Dufourea novaeangliae]|uniref:Uncharacterized protein n=1 Tax=Dufourea novaeangliae TaxID=178035 RepID=A0A154P8P9_DUFNO|nr:PREDICTED: diacylglycerol kinase A-like [Dufourea novaeangliae]KZC08242.1 hypothetical protein WN55_09145 [Dufourea novaeangliae]
MKAIVGVLLVLSVAEGTLFWRNILNGQRRGTFEPPGQSFQPPGQSFQPPGHTFQPPGHACPPPGRSFHSPAHGCPSLGPSYQPSGPSYPMPGLELGKQGPQNWPQQQQQPSQSNMLYVNSAEWVCQNPKTGDMMIITAVDGEQSQTGERPNPSVVPNANGNNNQGNSNNGNSNNAKASNGNNNNVKPTPQYHVTEPPLEHGGEGLIDIRLGTS